MNIRVLKTPPARGPWNMAVDEAVLLAKIPTLRLYSWSRPTLSLGYFQKTKEISLDFLKKSDIPLVRRMTGGKGVLHDREVTYSFIFPEELVSPKVIEAYKWIAAPLAGALNSLGVDAVLEEKPEKRKVSGNCFQAPSWYELTARGKKITGSAQIRKKGMLLQHGAVLLDINTPLLEGIFNLPQTLLSRQMTALSRELTQPPSREEFINIIEKSFKKKMDFPFISGTLTPAEKAMIPELEKKYRSAEWTFRC